MNIKLGYYPVLDMALALRQIYDPERFKPFGESMNNLYSKLNEKDLKFTDDIGNSTDGWKDVISRLINLTLEGMSNPEEFILSISDNPGSVLGPNNSSLSYGDQVRYLWRNYFSTETAKNSRQIFDRVIDISNIINDIGFIDYILSISDRYKRVDQNRLKILIKPEHVIETDKIENVIVMPSIFASRNVTFWFNENNYIFYISMKYPEFEEFEPSDMMLLKCLALNDKTRLKMLRMLHNKNYSVADMAERLKVNSSTVSRHIKVFKDSGFVDIFSQEGNSIYYSLNRREIKNAFDEILNYIEGGDEENDKDY